MSVDAVPVGGGGGADGAAAAARGATRNGPWGMRTKGRARMRNGRTEGLAMTVLRVGGLCYRREREEGREEIHAGEGLKVCRPVIIVGRDPCLGVTSTLQRAARHSPGWRSGIKYTLATTCEIDRPPSLLGDCCKTSFAGSATTTTGAEKLTIFSPSFSYTGAQQD